MQLLPLVRNVEGARVGHELLIGATCGIVVVASGRDDVGGGGAAKVGAAVAVLAAVAKRLD